MLNHIVVMGRLTRDPELRYTQTQTPVASFSVAVERDFADKATGERQTDFIDCVAWRSTAEFVSKYFQKGSMVAVSGRLQMRDWTDRDGNKRRSAEIVADNVYFGESRRSRDENAGGYSAPAPRGGYDAAPRQNAGGYNAAPRGGYDAAPRGESAFAELDDSDGELPF